VTVSFEDVEVTPTQGPLERLWETLEESVIELAWADRPPVPAPLRDSRGNRVLRNVEPCCGRKGEGGGIEGESITGDVGPRWLKRLAVGVG
jgi:hypothetical protein